MFNEILLAIEKAEKENNRQFVTALARGLSVLYLTSLYPHGMSYHQICEMTKLPKPTVTRLLKTLMNLKFLKQNQQTGLYVADVRLQELVMGQKSIDVTEQIKPLLLNFATTHNVSVSVAIAQYGEMLYLQSIRSPAKITVQLQIGSTVPLPDTAIGRAYYASLSEHDKKIINSDLVRLYPDDYGKKLAILQKQETFIKKHGYTVSEREFSKEILAIAVTVKHALAPHGIYAINVSVPSANMDMNTLIRKVAEPLKELAATIQQYMVSG
ncbi:IclR family transcriptional regulator [Pelistega indica]|uniref:IclR family transcriptional regulator n=1 Tax=Pelistega indica TaxID=1414851 RepID=V8GAH7_9BURK|nr:MULTISPECIES: IclR family transcriptional regulator C-terminal domain-containing protein [Pelistega]ETD72697.1 IclR family transcriptional regulator [Pelistega indica]